jgi:coproporphyrinogen III oxidase
MNIEEKKNISAKWFVNLRDKICAEFEKIETEYAAASHKPTALEHDVAPKFLRTCWTREDAGRDGGSGEMSVMRGNVFEKVGVNFSKVYGDFSDEFRQQIPGTEKSAKFWASGISLVAHMRSPLVPAVHMNTRFICTEGRSWFGGGADLNPAIENELDKKDFHAALKEACDQSNTDYYAKFSEWCDNYFFIKHRNVSRGVGGIFYDYLNSAEPFDSRSSSSAISARGFEADFEFTRNVGLAFLQIFPQIVRRHMLAEWSSEQREEQMRKRGLYAEFNLVYDRGTKFGLMTGGNAEAILMSLPPVAKW